MLSSNVYIESDDIPPPPYSSVINEIIHEGIILLHGMYCKLLAYSLCLQNLMLHKLKLLLNSMCHLKHQSKLSSDCDTAAIIIAKPLLQ